MLSSRLFGMFFLILEKLNIPIPKSDFKQFYWLLISSVLFTLFVSTLWFKPPFIFNIMAALGAILQFAAFGILIKVLQSHIITVKSNLSPQLIGILKTAALLFFLKMIMQLIGCIPYFSEIISSHVDLAIGYIHWVFLGVISLSLFGFLHHYKLMRLSKKTVQLFIVGFLLTEILLFYKGIVNWINVELIKNYYILLAVASGILFLSVALILKLQFKK